MSPWTMSKTFVWHMIDRFFRSAQHSLFQGRVLCPPLAGDFVALVHAPSALEARGLPMLRALAELVEASMDMFGSELHDDGVPDFGACNPRIGEDASLSSS